MIDEQPISAEAEERSTLAEQNSANGQGTEEGYRALHDQLPSWKRFEAEALRKHIEDDREIERELREGASGSSP